MKWFPWLFCGLLIVGLVAPLRGQTYPVQYLDNAPAAQPGSLGQQPFPAAQEQDLTPSQTNTKQLNQLFEFETTPDICAAGESYVTGRFDFLKFPGTVKEYRYQLQGQYAFTDQIAAGGFVPGITSVLNHTHTGVGDITLYAQYKLDRFISPEIVDVTVQLDAVLPTGNDGQLRDTGKFGVRPMLLAYKDFGQHGPGDFGLYGLCGFTITTDSDLRLGLAATYQINEWVGIFEFYDQNGIHGHPYVLVTPGISYRGLSSWEFSVGVPVGVDNGTPDWGIIAKITYAFAN